MREVRMALLEADVALPIVKEFVSNAREAAADAEVHKTKYTRRKKSLKIVHAELD